MSLDGIRVFVHVVQAGSFSAAARKLGMPKSTVSLRVAELEKRLGATLLRRTTRSVRPTESGTAYFATAARALSELQAAEEGVARAHDELRGTLRIAGSGSGTGLLGNLIAGFMKAHPHIDVDLVLADRHVDLLAENVDVAVRFGAVDDEAGLVARRIATSCRKMYASPGYVRQHPAICHPRDLRAHALLRYSDAPDIVLQSDGGARFRVSGAARFRANQIAALHHQALAGLGVAALPAGMVDSDVRKGTLVDVLPEWRSDVYPIHVIYPKQRFVPQRVRAFVDHATKAFVIGGRDREPVPRPARPREREAVRE